MLATRMRMGGGKRGFDVSSGSTIALGSDLTTKGGEGQKIKKLENGWLVTAHYSSAGIGQVIFKKSEDGGKTWGDLAYASGHATAGFSIATKGNIVYCVYARAGSESIFVRFAYFDATSVTNNPSISYTSIEPATGSTLSYGNGVSLAIQGDEIYSVWCSKQTTYTSFNIKARKGLISADNSVLWSTAEQVTTSNSTNFQYTNPCIVLSSSHKVIIASAQEGSSTFGLNAWRFVAGTGWIGALVFNGGGYSQNVPSAYIDSAQRIHVCWHGSEPGNTLFSIRYARSTNGGASWVAEVAVPAASNVMKWYANISIDKDNYVYIVYTNNTAGNRIEYVKKLNGGTGWVNTVTAFYNNCLHASVCQDILDFEIPPTIFTGDSSGSNIPGGIHFFGKWKEE